MKQELLEIIKSIEDTFYAILGFLEGKIEDELDLEIYREIEQNLKKLRENLKKLEERFQQTEE